MIAVAPHLHNMASRVLKAIRLNFGFVNKGDRNFETFSTVFDCVFGGGSAERRRAGATDCTESHNGPGWQGQDSSQYHYRC